MTARGLVPLGGHVFFEAAHGASDLPDCFISCSGASNSGVSKKLTGRYAETDAHLLYCRNLRLFLLFFAKTQKSLSVYALCVVQLLCAKLMTPSGKAEY